MQFYFFIFFHLLIVKTCFFISWGKFRVVSLAMSEWDRGKGRAYYWAGRQQRWCDTCDCANPYRDLEDVQRTVLLAVWPRWNNHCWDCAISGAKKEAAQEEATQEEAQQVARAKAEAADRHQALLEQKAADGERELRRLRAARSRSPRR